jgi:hypothetical protein
MIFKLATFILLRIRCLMKMHFLLLTLMMHDSILLQKNLLQAYIFLLAFRLLYSHNQYILPLVRQLPIWILPYILDSKFNPTEPTPTSCIMRHSIQIRSKPNIYKPNIHSNDTRTYLSKVHFI